MIILLGAKVIFLFYETHSYTHKLVKVIFPSHQGLRICLADLMQEKKVCVCVASFENWCMLLLDPWEPSSIFTCPGWLTTG